MITSGRGLAIAIAAAIAVTIAVIAGGGSPITDDHAIAPGFRADGVTGLRWRGGAGDVTVRRRAGAAIADADAWQIVIPGGTVVARADAIRDALAALRGGRWQRATGEIATHRGLVVDGATPHVIGIGASLPGGAQAWIAVDGRGLLVDAWIARALDAAPLALRVPSPLDEVGAATDVVITDATIALHLQPRPPARIIPASGPSFLTSSLRVAKLVRALANLTIVRLPTDESSPAHGRTITVTGPDRAHTGSLTVGGACAGAGWFVAVSGTWGDGCVDEEAAKAVVIAVDSFREPDHMLVDRDPVSVAIRQVTLFDGTRLDYTTGKVDGAPGNRKAMGDLYTALQYASGPGMGEPRFATPPLGKLVVDVVAGPPITIYVYPAHRFARDDEPFTLPIADTLWGLVHDGAATFRDLTPWLEEPTTVSELQIDAVRFVRGDVIGAWSRAPGGPVPAADARRLEALVKDLAQPYVLGEASEPVAAAHAITLTVTPPVGAPITHRVAIGPPIQIYCPAEAGTERILLRLDVCERVAALLR